jgi:hypothetical protein
MCGKTELTMKKIGASYEDLLSLNGTGDKDSNDNNKKSLVADFV